MVVRKYKQALFGYKVVEYIGVLISFGNGKLTRNVRANM